MHELITSVASVIILALYVMQFAMCENLYLELSACERILTEYDRNGYEGEIAAMELKDSLERIPNVSADVIGQMVEITIENIVVPVWNKGDNCIKVVRELGNEEHDNYDGCSPDDEHAH